MFWKKKPKVVALELGDSNFNEHVGGVGKPVLIDFWGHGCNPCNIMGPVIDELARDYEGRAIVAKVCTNYNPKLSQYFQIKSVPTLVIINDDKMVERFNGLVPKPNLEEFLDHYIDTWKDIDD